MERKGLDRVGKWTEVIAVGSNEFMEEIRKQLGVRAIGRKTVMNDGGYELAEAVIPYNQLFEP